MNMPQGYVVREIDVRNVSDEDIERHLVLANTLKAERRPEEPPTPLDLSIAGWRNIPSFVQMWEWFVSPEGSDEVIAMASCSFDKNAKENLHLIEISIQIDPAHRRKGLAKALLPILLAVAKEQDRRMLMFYSESVIPAGEAFAKRLDADPGLVHRTSELILANVDRRLLERWVNEGPGRAPGYSLEVIEGPYPVEMYEEMCAVFDIMNTAPRDGLDVEDEHTTPEKIAEWEKSSAARGTVRWSMLIRHDESGQLVGFTDTYWQPKLPKTLGQGGTAVHPDHRGFALGKWLKAAMLDKVLRERPEAERILTSNAYSNDAMLGINTALGFKEERSETFWQLDRAKAEAYVAS